MSPRSAAIRASPSGSCGLLGASSRISDSRLSVVCPAVAAVSRGSASIAATTASAWAAVGITNLIVALPVGAVPAAQPRSCVARIVYLPGASMRA